MYLTPTELERLVIFNAAELARRRKDRGLKLNYPETVAYITDAIIEGARENRSVANLIEFGAELLTTDDVLPGIKEMLPTVQVEGLFDDGTKLVTVHDPIRPGNETSASDEVVPGEILAEDGEIKLHEGRDGTTVTVTNTGDRPIQVGSHFHFFESNKALEFDRAAAFGMHLDIPAGTSARFEPGDSKDVALVEFGGSGEIYGLNNLTNGSRRSPEIKAEALRRAKDNGFKGA